MTPILWPGASKPDPALARAYRASTQEPENRANADWLDHAVITGTSPYALGWAVAFARVGIKATVFDDDPHDAARARDLLARAQQRDQAPDGITITGDLGDVTGAQVLIDTGQPPASALPTLDPKALILRAARADQSTPHTVLIDTANPPPAIGLIEMIGQPGSADPTLQKAKAVAHLLSATPILTPVFIGATLRARIEDAAEALIFAGSTPWEVDEAMENSGFTLGPCAAQDQRGLDLAYARHRAEDAAGTRRFPCPVLDRMVPEGRLGQKGGVGWYRYPGGGGRVIDPLIEDLAREEAHFAGTTVVHVSADDIRKLMILSLIDAATDLQAQGIPAAVIDRICAHTCGFPEALGGPLFLGNALRYPTVHAELSASAPLWAPGAGLAALAHSHKEQA